jgi:hypothetical protein
MSTISCIVWIHNAENSDHPKTAPSAFQMFKWLALFKPFDSSTKLGYFIYKIFFIHIKQASLVRLLKTGHICPVLKWYLITRPFNFRTNINHSKTELARYSDVHCILWKSKIRNIWALWNHRWSGVGVVLSNIL